MITVRLFASLAAEAARGEEEIQVEPRPGLTVADVVYEAGIRGSELYVVVVNGRGATADATVSDGDRVALFPPMSGG